MFRRKALNLYFMVVATAGIALLAVRCSSIPIDPSAQASDSNDKTVVFEGPGGESIRGYLFLQVTDGQPPSAQISIIVPKVDCKREACALFQFLRKDGSPGYTAGIKKGDTRAEFKLSDILAHVDGVGAKDEGEYRCKVQIYYDDADGNEHTFFTNGFIRVNILAQKYAPVGCNDPAIAWVAGVDDTHEAHFTTSGRSVVCGVTP